MIFTMTGMKMNRYAKVLMMSFYVNKAINPINVKATMQDSRNNVAICTVVLNMLGVFIRYMRIKNSSAIMMPINMISNILN